MIDAKEARAIASEFKETKFNNELQGIYQRIKECAEHGEFRVHLDKYVSKRAKDILIHDGYKVNYHTDYNEASTTIIW